MRKIQEGSDDLEWSALDWKDNPEESLSEVDHLLQSHGLEVVRFEAGDDSVCFAIDKIQSNEQLTTENFLQLCGELRNELNAPLPGGRGFQASRDKRILSLAKRLSQSTPPDRGIVT